MKSRFDAVNEVYLPYVKKHLGNNSLQNILTCGGSEGAVNTELERHKGFTYENIFHYELMDNQIDYDEVIKDNILCPELPIQSVNLIYADVGGSGVNIDGWEYGCILNILDNGFIDNELGVLVFLYFDGIETEPFLNRQYNNYKSKDSFSKNIEWYDDYNKATFIQRLDGVVFYD
jgi:hypothetical protein